jgi:N-acetylglucosamine-6-phosphate deacetylase
MAFALTGARLFDGSEFHDGLAVIVSGARIRDVVPATSLPPGLERVELQGGILAPGFNDVQVNGGGGALLNDAPTVETVARIASSHRAFGTTGLLPTVITDDADVLRAAVAAVRQARDAGMANVLGIHIEGPFLDPKRKGAHDARYIRAMTEEDLTEICNLGCGSVMLTVAPNCVSPRHISALSEAGVRVSLGHSEAGSFDVITALRAGASAFTHLYNAMSQLTGREAGMVGTALADDQSFVGIIADGLHVTNIPLRLALSAKRRDRFMLITDAMPSAAGGPDSFVLQGRVVRRNGRRLSLVDGTLAGSDLTMDEAVRHVVAHGDVSLAEALAMASAVPAEFLGRGQELGHIKPGFLASLVHLRDDLTVAQTWVEGT